MTRHVCNADGTLHDGTFGARMNHRGSQRVTKGFTLLNENVKIKVRNFVVYD
jgi:hypothetical protein